MEGEQLEKQSGLPYSSFDFIIITETKASFGTYQGEFWGDITFKNISTENDALLLDYNEGVMEVYFDTRTGTKIAGQSMMKTNAYGGVKLVQFVYMGANLEEAGKTYIKIFESKKTDTSRSPSLPIDFLGKSVDEVIKFHGNDYLVSPSNKGMALVYFDDGIAYKFANYTDFNRQPKATDKIIEVSLEKNQTTVYGNIKIGDSFKDALRTIPETYHDGKMTGESRIDGYYIKWIFSNSSEDNFKILYATVTRQ